MTLCKVLKGVSSALGSMAISHRSRLATLLRRGEATISGTLGLSIGSVIGNSCSHSSKVYRYTVVELGTTSFFFSAIAVIENKSVLLPLVLQS